ncbi:MAG: hypothetical protein AAB870_01285 [Patescibacteria group bacterium]|mgnify:FL=1
MAIDLRRKHGIRPATYNKRLATLEAQAQEAQDQADKHNDSVFIILLICTLTIDLLGFLGLAILAILLSPAVWLINLYLWFNNRELWKTEDYAVALGTSIMETIPLLGILPAATANAIQKWVRSAIRAQENRDKAQDLNKQIETLKRKQRAQELYSILPESFAPEEPTVSQAMLKKMSTDNERAAKKLSALPQLAQTNTGKQNKLPDQHAG